MTFTSIRIDPADKEFSRYIRERDGQCQRCGRQGQGEDKIIGLQNSHFYGRRKEAVRFDPENCDALCFYCHQHWGSNPEEYRAWKFKQLGEERFNALVVRANTYQKRDRKMSLLKAKVMLNNLRHQRGKDTGIIGKGYVRIDRSQNQIIAKYQ